MRALALLLAAVAIPAWAADDDDARITAEFCADARTTVDYNRCSAEELAQAQADLQATLGAALGKWKDSPETVSALQHAQALWEDSHRADVAARFADVDAARGRGEPVGTAYPAAHAWYEARLTRARTGQLCEFLRGAAYGERSREPCETLVQRAQANNRD